MYQAHIWKLIVYVFSPLDPDVMLLLRETVSLQLTVDADQVGHILALPVYQWVSMITAICYSNR